MSGCWTPSCFFFFCWCDSLVFLVSSLNMVKSIDCRVWTLSLFQENPNRVTMYFSLYVLLRLFAHILLCISVSDFRGDFNLDRFFVVSGFGLINELGHFPSSCFLEESMWSWWLFLL